MTNVYNTMKSRLFDFLRFSPNILKRLTVFAKSFQDTRDAIDYWLAQWTTTPAGFFQDLQGQIIGVKRPRAQHDYENIFTLCADGDTDDLDDSTGFEDTTDATVILGGYLTGEDGLEDLTDLDSEATDTYMQFLIDQKAAAYRKQPTRERLWSYLLAFGSRCRIYDDTTFLIEYDPVVYYDLDEWQKNYCVTRGYKPACRTIRFKEKYRNEDPI